LVLKVAARRIVVIPSAGIRMIMMMIMIIIQKKIARK